MILEVMSVPAVEAVDVDGCLCVDDVDVDRGALLFGAVMVVGGLWDFDRLVVAGSDRVDMCVIIESEVSSSSSCEWSPFRELVVYDANLENISKFIISGNKTE